MSDFQKELDMILQEAEEKKKKEVVSSMESLPESMDFKPKIKYNEATPDYDWETDAALIDYAGPVNYEWDTDAANVDKLKVWDEKIDKIGELWKELGRSKKDRAKKKQLRILYNKLQKEKCASKYWRSRGYRQNPNLDSSKKINDCVECPPPKKIFSKKKGKKCINNPRYATKNRIKGIPKRHKGDAPDSVLAPTGRYIDRKRAREYKDNGQYGTGKIFDLIEFGSEGRDELYLRRENQKIEGRMNKTKPSAMPKKASSKSLSYTKQELNKYRKDLKGLYEKKAKQKLQSKKITCEIRKLKITDNPYLIEKNKKKLLKLAEKACKLSEEYSNNELKLKLLKNASYKNEKVEGGGVKKSRKHVKKSKKSKKKRVKKSRKHVKKSKKSKKKRVKKSKKNKN